MLSLAKLASTDQRYYLDQAGGRVSHAGSVSSGAEDYYLAGPEAAGRWTGSAARLLGLGGRVGEASLGAVLSQQDPRSGVKLAGPAARARVPGYDLMFSVPKSASVLFGVGDERVQRAVLQAQERAVAAGLAYLERHACRTRMGAGGHQVVLGAGFVGAAFGHRTSRAGDPQIHTHVLVANATRRGDGLWGTLDGRQLYAQAKTAGYVHEAVFRHELTAMLSVAWREARNGIGDVEGVSDAVIDAFSRRRAEIDARVAQWGRTSAGARQSAALATRARKDYRVSPSMLAPEWRERAQSLGLDRSAIEGLLDRGDPRAPQTHDAVAEHLLSSRGVTAHASTFDRRDVVQAYAAQARGGTTVEDVEAFADFLLGHDEVVTLTAGGGSRSASRAATRAATSSASWSRSISSLTAGLAAEQIAANWALRIDGRARPCGWPDRPRRGVENRSPGPTMSTMLDFCLTYGRVGRYSGQDRGSRYAVFAGVSTMEPAGFEPPTSCLQSRRSPN